MAHLPDITHDRPRTTGRTKGLRNCSDDERARMRGLLHTMGAKESVASEPMEPRRRKGGVLIPAAVATMAAMAGLVWMAPSPAALIDATGKRLANLVPQTERPGETPAGPTVPNAAAPVPAPPPVAAAATAGPTLEASGQVVARRKATLSSDLTGRVTELLVAEGDRVSPGEAVARLDSESAEAQFAIAKANVAAAEKDRAVIAAELEALQGDLERTRTLADRGVASRQALSTLTGQRAVLRARIAASDQAVDVQRRQLDAMRNDLDRTLIVAHFSGIVTEITANVGEIVSPMAPGGYTQTGIATIVDPESIVGEVNVNEQFLSRIKEGQPVEMTVPAWPDRTFGGHVALVTPVVDNSTAAVRVTVTFDPLPDDVYPGMRLDVAFMPPDSIRPTGESTSTLTQGASR